MAMFGARNGKRSPGARGTTRQLVEWAALLAVSSDVVTCCDCGTCQRAEAMAVARRLRVLGERLSPAARTA